jgi:hypothetical protein
VAEGTRGVWGKGHGTILPREARGGGNGKG